MKDQRALALNRLQTRIAKLRTSKTSWLLPVRAEVCREISVYAVNLRKVSFRIVDETHCGAGYAELVDGRWVVLFHISSLSYGRRNLEPARKRKEAARELIQQKIEAWVPLHRRELRAADKRHRRAELLSAEANMLWAKAQLAQARRRMREAKRAA